MSTLTCSTCGAETTNPYRLCDLCRRRSTIAMRRAQGLPDFIDPNGEAWHRTQVRLGAARARQRRLATSSPPDAA